MKYNKLVRNKIPQQLKDQGHIVHARRVSDNKEYENYLYLKVIEEVMEFMNNPSEEEFVDLMEIMDAIKRHNNFFTANLEETREAKRKEKGGFEDGWILIEVDRDE